MDRIEFPCLYIFLWGWMGEVEGGTVRVRVFEFTVGTHGVLYSLIFGGVDYPSVSNLSRRWKFYSVKIKFCEREKVGECWRNRSCLRMEI